MPFLSENQLRVIKHRGKPLIVVAGPGTGKTRTLVERMISLLSEDNNREVIFITFTRTSRQDTEKKLLNTFGEESLDQTGLMFPRTSTLHRYAKQFVHKYASHISRDAYFTIPIESMGELDLILDEVVSDLDLGLSNKELSEALKLQRATTDWPTNFPLSVSERCTLLERYDLLLALYKTLDIEGVVLAAIEIMETGNIDLPRIFLQVDEYQDLNPMDHRFIDLIASHPASEIVVVGDDAQSIYSLRHAHPEGVKKLWESPDWERIPFPDSFRLPPHILNAALDLISDAGYVGANINRKQPTDKRILTLQCTTSDLQVEAAAKHMSHLIARAAKEGDTSINHGSFLVLCPTSNYARLTAMQLDQKYGIPAYVPSRTAIPEDFWTIILLLRILAHKDPLALRQWLTLLDFSLDEIIGLRDQSLTQEVPFYDLCLSVEDRRLDNFKSQLDELKKSLGDAGAFLDHLRSFDGIDMPADFGEFFRTILEDDEVIASLPTIIRAIYQKFGVLEEEEEIAQSPNRVLVATMHAAKGLEADFVYCLWMNGRFMPMPDRDQEEERRVLYVALTRARRDVVICFHEEYGGTPRRRIRWEALSPFLRAIGTHLSLRLMNAKIVRSSTLMWDN